MTCMTWSRQFSFDDPFHFAADVAKALALHAQLAQRWRRTSKRISQAFRCTRPGFSTRRFVVVQARQNVLHARLDAVGVGFDELQHRRRYGARIEGAGHRLGSGCLELLEELVRVRA